MHIIKMLFQAISEDLSYRINHHFTVENLSCSQFSQAAFFRDEFVGNAIGVLKQKGSSEYWLVSFEKLAHTALISTILSGYHDIHRPILNGRRLTRADRALIGLFLEEVTNSMNHILKDYDGSEWEFVGILPEGTVLRMSEEKSQSEILGLRLFSLDWDLPIYLTKRTDIFFGALKTIREERDRFRKAIIENRDKAHYGCEEDGHINSFLYQTLSASRLFADPSNYSLYLTAQHPQVMAFLVAALDQPEGALVRLPWSLSAELVYRCCSTYRTWADALIALNEAVRLDYHFQVNLAPVFQIDFQVIGNILRKAEKSSPQITQGSLSKNYPELFEKLRCYLVDDH